MDALTEIFDVPKPVIGMVHLRPLPGAPRYDPASMGMDRIADMAVREAEQLARAGVDGLQIENIWDYPYLPGARIGHETTAALAVVAAQVCAAVDLPVGINCHLNGGPQALAAAVAAGARWIRVFAWVNAYISHAGLIEGIGAELARYREALKASQIKFLCDVNVKHGSHFIVSDRPVVEQARDAESEGAEALIVTGFETGKSPSPDRVRELRQAVGVPVLIGSGMTQDNVPDLLRYADGAIVGSAFKVGQQWKAPVDEVAARTFMDAVKAFRADLKKTE